MSASRRLQPSLSVDSGRPRRKNGLLVQRDERTIRWRLRPSNRFSKPESRSVERRDADGRSAQEFVLLRSAMMYLPNFFDGFERLVAFDAETTGKRTPEAEFILKQPFAWSPWHHH